MSERKSKEVPGGTPANVQGDNLNKKKHKFKMPGAFQIVFFMLALVCIMSFFIPVSVQDADTGKIVYNAMLDSSGNVVANAGPQPKGLWDLIIAPIQGFQNSAAVGIAIFLAGAFLNVLNSTKSFEAGIGKLLTKLKGNALVAIMLFVFAIMGTVFGFWEEITAFSLVVIPMFILAGYDIMTGFAVLFIGATIGNMSSIVNPFSTGAAVAAIGNPDLTIGSGLILRMVMFVVMYIIAAIMLMKYAAKVKKDPGRSVLAKVQGLKEIEIDKNKSPEITRSRFWSIIVFAAIIILMLIGYTPWESIGGTTLSNIVNAPIVFLGNIPVLGDILGAGNVTPLGEWGFNEFSFLFLAGSLLLIPINHMKVNDFIDKFIDGAAGMLSVVLVLSIANGIAVIMGDSTYGMSVTFVYWISTALAGVPLWIFAVVAVLAYIGIGFFLQSTSGVAGLTMPILGAVAAGLFTATSIGVVGGQIILIGAFIVGINFMCAIYPTGTLMGTLQLFGLPYEHYLKFSLKYYIPLLLAGTVILSIAPYIGLVM